MTTLSKRIFTHWWRFSCKFKEVFVPAAKTYSFPVLCAISTASLIMYFTYKYGKFQGIKNVPKVHVLVHTTKLREEKRIAQMGSKEKRFVRYASVRYGETIFMTPQDFLESVVEAEPRPRLRRKLLSKEELKIIKTSTPTLGIHGASPELFTKLHDVGIICYSEYVFLLSILTKAEYSFKVAFNMFDLDANGTVNKDEFLEMEKIFGMTPNINHVRGVGLPKKKDRSDEIETTLLLHFFGYDGADKLDFHRFRTFMIAIQTEALSLEFYKFSKGFPKMAPVDFATVLLRYCFLSYDEYEDRMKRVSNEIGRITLGDFLVFFSFLNDLEDFTVAMRMLTQDSISKELFTRGVKVCTGNEIGAPVVDVIFAIFGSPDGFLTNYQDFLQVMKDRRYRGFKLYKKSDGWHAFKKCLRREL